MTVQCSWSRGEELKTQLYTGLVSLVFVYFYFYKTSSAYRWASGVVNNLR